MTAHTLFERRQRQDFIQAKLPRLGAKAIHGDGPGDRFEILGIFRGLFLLGAELVKVVVGGDFFIAVDLFIHAERALADIGQLGARRGPGRGQKQFAGAQERGRRASEKLPAVQPHVLGRNL